MNNQVQSILTGVYLAACGFQAAKNSNIPAILKKIHPHGGTAMRDSLIQGCELMLKLNQALRDTGTDGNWDFVHVLLTDGIDEHSTNSIQDAIKVMLIIGKLINVKSLKIIFIGVGVNSVAERQLQMLAQVGGQNSEYYNVKSSQIVNIFNKIQLSLGLQKRIDMIGISSNNGNAVFLKQQVNPYLQLSLKNYIIMFNLDVSSSMSSNNKWQNVCRSVATFISKLGPGDVVSALVFNNQTKLLTTLSANDKLFELPKKQVLPISTETVNNKNKKQVALNMKKEKVCCEIM